MIKGKKIQYIINRGQKCVRERGRERECVQDKERGKMNVFLSYVSII